MFVAMGRPSAVANMSGGGGVPDLFGSVKFYPMSMGVLVVADIGGLPQTETGIFGFHIHEGTNCGGGGFKNTGNHYNPETMPHPMHAGDLPPLFSCDGIAYLAVLTDRIAVEDIIGKTVVIHSAPDDFTSQPSGNAGTKIACGVITAI